MSSSDKTSIHTLIDNAINRHVSEDIDKKILTSFLKFLIPLAQNRFNSNLKKHTYNFELYFTWYIGEVINTYNKKLQTITSPLLAPQWNEWRSKNPTQ